jgi:hypothetical protein
VHRRQRRRGLRRPGLAFLIPLGCTAVMAMMLMHRQHALVALAGTVLALARTKVRSFMLQVQRLRVRLLTRA